MEEFLNYFDYLRQKVNEQMPENIEEYYNLLRSQKIVEKPILTDIGTDILQYLQTQDIKPIKAKEIADGLGISSRKVSGAMRKLVTDSFVEKFGANPVVYALTNKKKNFNIQDYKENR